MRRRGSAVTSGGNIQAALGPLAGATISAYKISDLGQPVETTEANGSTTDLQTAGTFSLALTGIDDDEWILVTATGGSDIDADDDGIIDASPTANNGTVHALAKAADWRDGGRINIISEIAWQEIAASVGTDRAAAIAAKLNILAAQLVKTDINNDGEINYLDLTAFNPAEQTDQDSLSVPFSDIQAKDAAAASLFDYIHQDKVDKEQQRIKTLFGNKQIGRAHV